MRRSDCTSRTTCKTSAPWRSRSSIRRTRPALRAICFTTTSPTINREPKASRMHDVAHIRREKDRGSSPAARRAAAFTLIELLIAMSIMLILAAITVRLVMGNLDSDRMKGGSRELQSYLAGARDRAIYAGQPRGVRFIPDPTDLGTVRRFVYIGATVNFTDGAQVQIAADKRTISTSPTTYVPPASWANLVQRGQLTNGAQITLGGTFYTMA